MPDRDQPHLLRRRNAGAELRKRVVLAELARPRTQTELQRRLGMSRSGTLHLLRRMEAQGLVRAAERIGGTQIWERRDSSQARR
ncbi:MarR family transcriptional regulator [Pseudooceanicola sp. 200-1SW]|uniref:MarR family transcriptional regulator n=1 Tax=Pseudooceanicola sp. 200-1SW TaxID=3425949 RepID=UPI003D7FCA5D